MRLSMIDVDAAVLKRELEVRHLMRTRARGAASMTGLPVEGRFAGVRRSLFARFTRRPAKSVDLVEQLSTSPQTVA